MKKLVLTMLLTMGMILCVACGKEPQGTISNGDSSEIVNATQAEESSVEVSDAQEEDLSELVEVIGEYYYVDSIGQAKHALVVKNNSSKTVTVSVNVIAKDAAGKAIGAGTSSVDAIPSGCEVCVVNSVHEVENLKVFEYTLTVDETVSYLKPLIQDLTFEQSLVGEKVIVTCTNNGKEDAKNIEVTALFFRDNEFAYYGVSWIPEIKAGATVAVEVYSYESHLKEKTYNEAKVYLSGWR